MKAFTHESYETCADPESFARGGPNLKMFFDVGIEDPNTAINGPISAHHLNGVSLACR